MGVLYIVTPPTNEVVDWLDEIGIALPKSTSSRGPLLSELCHVLDSLEGYSADYTDNGEGALWQAMIRSTESPESGRWTLINISERTKALDPQEIWFEKGHPELIVEILSQLALQCGTLVVIPDTGCLPLVINANDDPHQLCSKWEHLNSSNS